MPHIHIPFSLLILLALLIFVGDVLLVAAPSEALKI